MHIVITGASSGIGAAYARHFSREGHKLTLVARRHDLLSALAAELPCEAHVVAQDLGDLDSATSFLGAAEDALGPIDVLVNNAGVQVVGPFAQTSSEEGERCIQVDLLAPLRLTRAVLPGMVQRKAGVIVDVASMAALAPTPGMAYYNAAKGGLAAASEALRAELRPLGVHVVTVYPGIIASTAMAQAAMNKYGDSAAMSYAPRGTEEMLAELTLNAITARRDRVIYPRSGALARWFPGTTRWLMDRFTPALRGD